MLVVVLVECGSHAVVDAALGSRSNGELNLAQGLMGSLAPGMLVLGDRNVPSSQMVRAVVATGGDLYFRVKAGR